LAQAEGLPAADLHQRAREVFGGAGDPVAEFDTPCPSL
jgi:hypothetical protein